jgi:hypothetical protein
MLGCIRQMISDDGERVNQSTQWSEYGPDRFDNRQGQGYHGLGGGWGPVASTVFKIDGGSRRASRGGFDSHALPPSSRSG